MKSMIAVVILLMAILCLKTWKGSSADATATEKREFLAFEPCLPKITLNREQLLMSDGAKEKSALELCESAENSQKNMSQSPAELWQALEEAFLSAELLNQCKNPSGPLKIRVIDLKSSLVKIQVDWVHELEMEVTRHQRKGNFDEARFCLRRLIRLVPDEEHPYRKRWVREVR